MSSLQNLPTSLLSRIAASSITSSFVVGEAGEIATASGSSKGLGNQTDLELLKALRANAEVVLTSGLTARVENYRMPRHADLAIFTKTGVQGLDLKPRAGQKLQVLGAPQVLSYSQALLALRSQYQRIHVEFGPKGAREVRDQIDLFVLSGLNHVGIKLFAEALKLEIEADFQVDNLFITLAVGRG